MPSFTDSKQREWEIRFDAPAIIRIREKIDDPKFMVIATHEDLQKLFEEIQSDPVLLCLIIYEVCKQQRDSAEVNEETFYLEVLGDSIDPATVALEEAIVSFTHRRLRGSMKVFAEQEKTQAEAIERALRKINDPNLKQELMAKLDAQIDLNLKKMMTPLSGATS